MVISTPIRLGVIVTALATAWACSAEFGGRCAATDDCSDDRVCIQGYCLPEDSADGDGGVTDARPGDGGETDADPADAGDGGPEADGGPVGDETFGASCRFDEVPVVPQYDLDFRPCADQHTVALWRFDRDFDALAPQGIEAPTRNRDPSDAVEIRGDQGASNGAAWFDSGDDPRFRMEDPLWSGGPFTVELWVWLEGHDGSARALLSNVRWDGSGRGGFELLVAPIGDVYQLIFSVPGPADRDLVIADAAFDAERWVHIAVTYDGTDSLWTFVDGAAQQLPLPELMANPARLRFGHTIDRRRFPGAIDEVRISNIARDPGVLGKVAQGFERP